MRKTNLLWLALLCTIFSCSKTSDSSPNDIAGTWVFTSGVSASYAYPAVLQNPSAIVEQGNTVVSDDSIRITFNGNGSYTFLNHRLPPDAGTYRVSQDSFLIIQPDSAAFIKFSYPALGVVAGTTDTSGTLPKPEPYANFQFVSDTILIKKSSNGIIFSTAWLTHTSYPLALTNDTLLLNINSSNFKRQ